MCYKFPPAPSVLEQSTALLCLFVYTLSGSHVSLFLIFQPLTNILMMNIWITHTHTRIPPHHGSSTHQCFTKHQASFTHQGSGPLRTSAPYQALTSPIRVLRSLQTSGRPLHSRRLRKPGVLEKSVLSTHFSFIHHSFFLHQRLSTHQDLSTHQGPSTHQPHHTLGSLYTPAPSRARFPSRTRTTPGIRVPHHSRPPPRTKPSSHGPRYTLRNPLHTRPFPYPRAPPYIGIWCLK